MRARRTGLLAIGIALAFAGAVAGQAGGSRASYSYVRETSGDVTVDSRWNGKVNASRNMPISVGDAIDVSSGGRAEVGLADGNVLYVGGATRAVFSSLADQQGEDDAFSMVRLEEGSLILAAFGSERSLPRVDTEDATIYLPAGGRARVNYDPNRGTVVISRAGDIEVRTREGSYRVRPGEYLMAHGEEEPEIERGTFSRDRFDIWAADRSDVSLETQSASARYVDEDYAGDVQSLDGYGDWDYNDTYNNYVWRPRVAAGWSPYSNGSWYYTPAGLTWWSGDPWGWFPYHYGNWFFDASWSSWCWSPAYVYSPAWVYWCYTPSYVGWCPTGWYGYYSPWYSGYYRHWGWGGHGGIYFSINGRFSTQSVDFRGWNFTGAGGMGTAGRLDVIPGSRIGNRLGDSVSVSSRPIVVSARPGQARDAVQSFVREAPRVVGRAGGDDASRFAPILARERNLPAASVDALRDRAVIAERGRLAGPGAADIAPRGARVDQSRTIEMRGRDSAAAPRDAISQRGQGQPASNGNSPDRSFSGGSRNRIEPRTVIRGDENGVEARTPRREAPTNDWRGSSRSRDSRSTDTIERAPVPNNRSIDSNREVSRPEVSRPAPAPRSEWRSRSRVTELPSRAMPNRELPGREGVDRPRSADQWRSRPSVPPARRVIEGAVPGRRDSDFDSFRRSQPRDGVREMPRNYRSDPRSYRPDSAPRSFSAPPRSAPAPRGEVRSAPAPRSAPPSVAPRPAPQAPRHGRN